MTGPARAGLFIYAHDLPRLADFYQTLLSMNRVHASAERVILSSPDLQIVVHALPASLTASLTLAVPAVRREEAAYKFFVTVASLSDAAQCAAALGGEVLAERWQGPGFTVCNAVDPEGNIFQLRESA